MHVRPGRAARLRVLVVDDSTTSRSLLAGLLNESPHLEVIGEASSGPQAVRMTARLRPDVITMDIHMPFMDGYETTRRIMEETPLPIVIVSADHHTENVAKSFRALEAGALAVFPKPGTGPATDFDSRAAELVEAVRLMAGVKVIRRHSRPRRRREIEPPSKVPRIAEVVAIGASTGGPAALAQLLARLPADFAAPILVVQHLARGFEAGLTAWLDGVSPLAVRLAEDGDELVPGRVLIAPHDVHLGVSRGRRVVLEESDPIGRHRPSATHLFRSVGDAFGSGSLGVILTGMGDDGVAGLGNLRRAGGHVLAQDKSSCVVYGMPGAAVAAGVVDEVVPLGMLPETIDRCCRSLT